MGAGGTERASLESAATVALLASALAFVARHEIPQDRPTTVRTLWRHILACPNESASIGAIATG